MLNGLINYIPAIKYGNLVDNAELNPAIGQTATVTLTSANLTSMYTTPVQLVTTTIAGTAIIVESAVFEMNGTNTTYTGGGAINMQYGSQSNTNNILASTFPANLLSTTATGVVTYMASSATAVGVLPNQGITISNINGVFAAGTGTAKVTINYYVVTI